MMQRYSYQVCALASSNVMEPHLVHDCRMVAREGPCMPMLLVAVVKSRQDYAALSYHVSKKREGEKYAIVDSY